MSSWWGKDDTRDPREGGSLDRSWPPPLPRCRCFCALLLLLVGLPAAAAAAANRRCAVVVGSAVCEY